MSANDELQAHTCEKMLEFYGDVANNVAQGNLQDNVKKSHITTENKPKSKKTTKDVQKKCLSLTEQWKKGELESGWYYVKGADGLIGMMSDYALYRVNLEHPDNEITLLAKMPSYEEYSRLEWYAGCGPDRIVELNKENRQLLKWCEEFNALDVAKENQQLKELLKEIIADADLSYCDSDIELRIDEVLK